MRRHPRPSRGTRAAGGVLAIALTLAACTSDGAGDAASSDSSAVTAERPLAVDERSFHREQGDCGRPDGDSVAVPCVDVTIDYVEVTDALTPALADSVRAFVRGFAFALPLAYEDTTSGPADADSLFRTMVSERGEYETHGGSHPWSLEREVEVRCQSARAVSLAASQYSYTGGAHGLGIVRLASFDPRTGRRITLRDLVADSAAVAAIAERAFREQQEIPEGQSLADAGYIFFEDGRFALNENFLLCDDALTFHYDPYEIAPYAMGPSMLVLPLDGIREHLADPPRS